MDAPYLDQVLALGLGDQGLQLGRCEGVDEARLGHDQQQHLCAGQDGQLVGLRADGAVSKHGGRKHGARRHGARGGFGGAPSS